MAAPTKAELLAAADASDDEAGRLEVQAAALREQARVLRGLAGKADLTTTYPKGTLPGTQMQAPSPSPGANISAAKSKARLPLQQALIKRNLSLPEWARAQRRPVLDVEKAKSWLKRSPKGARKIPREWADRIEREFKDERGRSEVPATLESWPNGISEE